MVGGGVFCVGASGKERGWDYIVNMREFKIPARHSPAACVYYVLLVFLSHMDTLDTSPFAWQILASSFVSHA